MATAIDPTGRGRKARTITATDPATGATLTRSTARAYCAVVVVGDPALGEAWPRNWAGRPDLADKALAKWATYCPHARLAPVTFDPWAAPEPEPATPEPAAAPVATPDPLAAAAADLAAALEPHPLSLQAEGRRLAAARVTLPGEPPAAAPVPPAGPEPTLPTLRAAAAAGRPVSLAALSRTLGRELGLATGGRRPARPGYQPADPLEGLPWDPGTPAARARHADQGRRAAILWPVAQAITGAGHRLPPSWASDGPVLNGQVGPVTALAALPAALLESAAAALAALPPVTPAQAQALELVRDALAR